MPFRPGVREGAELDSDLEDAVRSQGEIEAGVCEGRRGVASFGDQEGIIAQHASSRANPRGSAWTGKLPANAIDGKDIRPLMFGAKVAKSPHDALFFYNRHAMGLDRRSNDSQL